MNFFLKKPRQLSVFINLLKQIQAVLRWYQTAWGEMML